MQKHYFELDKVDSITLTLERETNYKWFPEIPASPKTFLGIKYGMYDAIPAGWNDSIDIEGNEYRKRYRKQSHQFDEYQSYRIDETNKKIYNKARVEIRLGYKQYFGLTFESNMLAKAYIDDLILGTGKEFHIIINK